MGIKIAELVQMQKRLNRANGHDVVPKGKPLWQVFAEEDQQKGPRKRPRIKEPDYATVFRASCLDAGVPVPEFEYHFHPDRNWRFDIAWPVHWVAVEVQGGLFRGRPCPTCGMRSGGRHNQGAALREEQQKATEAACRGWRILYCVPEALLRRRLLDQIQNALAWDRALHPEHVQFPV